MLLFYETSFSIFVLQFGLLPHTRKVHLGVNSVQIDPMPSLIPLNPQTVASLGVTVFGYDTTNDSILNYKTNPS